MKLLDVYWLKDKALWLSQETDIYNEYIDTSPKAMCLFAIDWWKFNDRPYGNNIKEPKIYYKGFSIKFYLTYWQVCVTLRLGKLPYTTYDGYRQWRKSDKRKTN